MEKIIEVKDVTMQFTMANDRVSSLKEFVVNLLKHKIKFEKFEALSHVSLDVYPGDVVGLIGHNGAGKSTMLKIISGILKPTYGTVKVAGNIAPMLELGSGFDPDMSGKENIYLNGAILGYSQKFLESKYDEIVAFAELEKFIDVPIRNYSSGMIARLAFAVATVVNPEILIVDEILSVGDMNFQAKSSARMKEMMSNGTTVLMVNHDIDAIKNMCNKVLWIENGKMVKFGNAQEVCDEYIKESLSQIESESQKAPQ